ncbi:unnamed protein product [Clonostachys solani]|uniref:NADP-dependent oxidoreductase domain-containing protein n=1 Tax=Clonostachys solani TaxID=160281 RepID=A0A9N9W8T6_9HYPO|nr:unnamed protein product [Clonostachys solani]
MANLKNSSKSYTLASGDKIPAIGLGTWQSTKDQTVRAVEAALAAGYRYIDTAAGYGNESEVGQGLKNSGIPREQVWITTKLNNPDHKRAPEVLEESLKNLGIDYLDLWLMHWPCSTDPSKENAHYEDWNFIDTWREMQILHATGKIRNIGVSNFGITNMEKLLSHPSCKIVPAVNQVELHPNNPSFRLVQYCQDKGIHLTGYSCLGSTNSPLYKDPTLLSIAKAKGKTPQQCLLQWGIQHGWDVIPKSVTASRIQDNFNLDGWDLTEDEMKKLDALPDRFKVGNDDWLPIKVFFGDDEEPVGSQEGKTIKNRSSL